MSLYDWLLFLHVAAAFSLVGGIAVYGVVILGGADDVARRALAVPALAMWNAGGLGVLVLGIALALEVDTYEVWDGWILAAIVLWFVASAAGGPLSRDVRDASRQLDLSAGRVRLAVMALATLLLLVDMIFKPGA